MQQKISEYEEQLESLLNKCSSLEKQKSRLQSEVEVLIMDLEKVNNERLNSNEDENNTIINLAFRQQLMLKT